MKYIIKLLNLKQQQQQNKLIRHTWRQPPTLTLVNTWGDLAPHQSHGVCTHTRKFSHVDFLRPVKWRQHVCRRMASKSALPSDTLWAVALPRSQCQEKLITKFKPRRQESDLPVFWPVRSCLWWWGARSRWWGKNTCVKQSLIQCAVILALLVC